jgi:hypothetical protein
MLLAVLLLAGCGKKEGSGSAVERPTPPERVPTTEAPAATVAAETLWKEYGQDKAAADGKYRGKVLAVKGRVHTVFPEEDGNTLNLFASPDDTSNRSQPPGVAGKFDHSLRQSLGKLPPGGEVEVIGKCTGRVDTRSGRDGYLVVLENCRLGTTGSDEPAEKNEKNEKK